jgi:hypothetical protein
MKVRDQADSSLLRAGIFKVRCSEKGSSKGYRDGNRTRACRRYLYITCEPAPGSAGEEAGYENPRRDGEAVGPAVEQVVHHKEQRQGGDLVGAVRIMQQGSHRLLRGLEPAEKKE